MPTKAEATPPPADEPAQAPVAEVETQPAAPQDPPAEAPPPAPPWGHWRYTGPAGRVYTTIPVTPEPGDIVAWPEVPSTDGCWEPTDDAATQQADNHPDTIAATEAALLEASKEG